MFSFKSNFIALSRKTRQRNQCYFSNHHPAVISTVYGVFSTPHCLQHSTLLQAKYQPENNETFVSEWSPKSFQITKKLLAEKIVSFKHQGDGVKSKLKIRRKCFPFANVFFPSPWTEADSVIPWSLCYTHF